MPDTSNILLVPLLLCACAPSGAKDSDASLVCGDGTHEEDGACVVDEDTGADTNAETGQPGETGDTTDSGGTADSGDSADTAEDSGGDTQETGIVSCDVAADGSATFRTLQDAVDAASDGGELTICAGTYGAVTVQLADGLTLRAVEEGVIIDGGTGTAVTVASVQLRLEGVALTGKAGTIEAAAVYSDGGDVTLVDSTIYEGELASAYDYSAMGVYAHGGSLTLEDVMFRDNAVTYAVYADLGAKLELSHTTFQDNMPDLTGAGVLLIFADSSVDVEVSNSLFVRNTSLAYTAMLSFGGPGTTVWIYNNTFVDNTTDLDAEGLVHLAASASFENNVVYDNGGNGLMIDSGASVEYNDVFGSTGTNYPSSGSVSATNLESDPRLVDPDAGDYALDVAFSPCVDMGNPASGYNDVDGTRNDLGAFGGPNGSWP